MKLLPILLLLFLSACQGNINDSSVASRADDRIQYASGLSIVPYDSYTVVTVKDPWPNATKSYRYVLAKELSSIPDSLRNLTTVKVPVQKIIVTSTTHIPSLEMLGVEKSLIGFPNTDYISSEKIRSMIDAGQVRNLGSNQSMNVEAVIDLETDVLVGYGIDNSNPTLEKLERGGVKILLNGDWNEQTPLGKAEWIKFFGTLFDLDAKADSIFSSIEKEYLDAKKIASNANSKPTVMAGSIFENRWYMPQGNSWGAIIIEDAGGLYIWADSKGTGSLSLPTETVLEQAGDADIWIGPEMGNLHEMEKANPHYKLFKAFKNGNVYNFTSRKGRTGGVVYYELGPNRPDIVLKDVIKILHPELLPGYEPFFFQKLK